MIGRILAFTVSLLLLAVCVAIAMGFVSIVGSEIVPAVAVGSFNVETESMILNRVWHGNEIYGILTIYLVLIACLAVAAYWLIRKAFRRLPGKAEAGTA